MFASRHCTLRVSNNLHDIVTSYLLAIERVLRGKPKDNVFEVIFLMIPVLFLANFFFTISGVKYVVGL